MNENIKILHLEDSVKDSELINSIITSGKIEHDYFWVDNEKDFVIALETKAIDIILSDYNLPGYNGNEALQVVRENHPNTPFLFVSGAMGEDAAINAMLNGATDYVLKNKLERLVPAIKRAIHEYQIEDECKQAEETIRKKDEHYKALIENIFKFIPEGILVFTESMSLLKQNKAFGDIIRKYAPVLGYTEEELAQKIIEQLSSEILSGEKTEIRISRKSQ